MIELLQQIQLRPLFGQGRIAIANMLDELVDVGLRRVDIVSLIKAR